jgi:hypothetical protein
MGCCLLVETIVKDIEQRTKLPLSHLPKTRSFLCEGDLESCAIQSWGSGLLVPNI